ncbi:hypothetical protein CVT25_013262 [Psilocybe cyanescens]|uniref:THH1/TOM1/TOM3 domain-containing protein n=1 Tax=Psilocybe cyanescens TaxID=93625 RepID=A0A409XK41_PSICY|nr:hypothetical protein CVT25_013262 [Psilocybe cyanescens]
MSTSDQPFSTNFQQAEISSNLNSSMLLNYLMGIYTLVYAGTLFIYSSNKATHANRRIVLSAISVLYLLCFVQFVVQWYSIDLDVVINGDTRESIFFSTVEGGPKWLWVFANVPFYASFVASDGLLIWRCYHVWGRSFRVISVLLILLLAEFGLFVTATILEGLSHRLTSGANTSAALFNSLTSALVFVSLATTVTTSLLIGYRIYSVARLNGQPSKRLFKHIVVLVIESAAVYSFVLLLDAVFAVIPSFNLVGSPLYQAGYFVDAVLIVVPGMAPTVLVARIAVTNSNYTVEPTITHISNLHFESQQGSMRGRSANVTIDRRR